MYGRLSSIMFPIVALLLVGALYWGYQEHQEKNSILIKAENQYQRAFHDLTFNMEKLHQQLGNTLAVHSNSQGVHRKGLVNAWRLTSQAQNDISQLPLSYLPFNEAEDFLSRISNFSYKTAVRDLTAQPLSAEEFQTLKTLYAKSKEIAADLHKMQDDVLSNQLRWMDVEIAIAAEQDNNPNSIVDGLKSVDKKVSEYPKLDWGPSVTSMYEKRTIRMLSGDSVTAEEIKEKAARFAKSSPDAVTVVENGKGTEFASYSATINGHDQNSNIQMDYTHKGGQLISYMNPRDISGRSIDQTQAKLSAEAFLEKHGFNNMRAVSYDLFSNTGTFTYVSSQSGVLIYPDKLTVKVGLDNGEVVGLHATDYVYEHRERDLPSPILSKEEAMKAINPEMKIHNEQLALIDGELGEEVLCYEYTGQINGKLYRLYINAETGIEESIEEVSPQDEKAAGNK